MASVQELEDALRNAHKAGDTRAARKLADALIMERQKAALSGGGVIPEQQQAIPGLDPNQPQGFTPDPSVAAIEAEANRQPTTLGGMMARDVPRTARGVAQGTTLGFSDEALAGVRSLTGENYGEALADERAELEKLGGARLPAELLGSLPLGVAAGGRAAAAKTLGGRVGQGALMGGGFGGAYGFGSGEGGLMPRLENAVVSGGIGAAGGAAIPLGIEGIGRGARFAGERVIPGLQRLVKNTQGAQGTVRDQAARRVAQTILEQYPDMSPQQAVRNAQRVVQRYGPRAALMDAGDLTRELAKTTVRQGGTPGMKVEKFARQRQEGTLAPSGQVRGGQYERVSGMLDDLVPENAYTTRGILSKSTEAGRQFYKEAYSANQSVDSPLIRRILKTPEAADALEVAATRAQNKMTLAGKPDPELTALAAELRQLGKMPDEATGVGISKGLKLETLDHVKRGLQQVWRSGRNSENAVARERAKNAGELARELTKELDRLDVTARAGPKSFKIEGGSYARARAAEQARLRAREALSSGEDFIKKSTFKNKDELRAALSEMTPEERHTFRVGAAQTLKDMAGDIGGTNDIVSRMWNKPNLRDKVRLAFGDAKTFRKYVRGLMGEKEMFKSYSALTRGSDTAKNLASMQKDVGAAGMGGEVAGAGIDLATGNKIGLGYRLGRMLRPRGILGPPEPVRQEMAGILTSQNIDDLLRAAEIASGGALNRRALEQALLAGQVSGAQRGILQ